MVLNFEILPQRMAVCKLAADAAVPADLLSIHFCAITRTEDELSLVLPEKQLPASVLSELGMSGQEAPQIMSADKENTHSGWQVEGGWQGLKIVGPLDFGMIGVIARISGSLAKAGIPIFVISTYDTDYIFVKELHFLSACDVIRSEGHSVKALR